MCVIYGGKPHLVIFDGLGFYTVTLLIEGSSEPVSHIRRRIYKWSFCVSLTVCVWHMIGNHNWWFLNAWCYTYPLFSWTMGVGLWDHIRRSFHKWLFWVFLAVCGWYMMENHSWWFLNACSCICPLCLWRVGVSLWDHMSRSFHKWLFWVYLAVCVWNMMGNHSWWFFNARCCT